MKLYGNENSGHAYKVALALTLSQIDYEYIWVDISKPCATRPLEFQEKSRWCEVPLLLVDGKHLTQSGAILIYLARHHGIFGGEATLDQANEWVIWEANRIGMSIPQLIQAQVTPEAFNEGSLAFLRGRFEIDRARLDGALQSQPFLIGNKPSIADIAVFGYVSRAEDYGIPLTPTINEWMARIRALPYFQSYQSLLASG